MRALLIAAACAATACLCLPAQADVLDRVRHDGVLHCGAEPRPSFAEMRRDGAVGGAAVDACRAVAAAVLGKQAKIAFDLYDSSRAFDAVRDDRDELFFLSDDAVADEHLAPHIVRGPSVFTEKISLMVPQNAPARRPQDLAAAPVCFMIASGAQRALDAAFAKWRLDFEHLAFEEDVEMLDAYNVQRCIAVAAEATQLAVLASDGGINHLTSRILPDALATYPVFVATGVGDSAWSARAFGAIAK
jgi:general L-amino acid transport system substrate-binding protein